MYFGIADIMGHPWDTLMELYQLRVKPAPFAQVADYGESFVAMLDSLPDFFPAHRQREDYKRLLASVFRYIFQLAQDLRENGGPGRASATDTRLLQDAIERVWHDYQYCEDGTSRGELSCFPPGFGKRVLKEHAQTIEELIIHGFQPFGLNAVSIKRLYDIAAFAVIKDLFLEDVSGLVFAGFGTKDHYPASVTYYISAVVCGIAKRAVASHDAIDGANRANIRVYADSDVTNAFIRGIDAQMERHLQNGAGSMLTGLMDQIIAAFPGIREREKQTVRRRIQSDLLPQYLSRFREMMDSYQQQTFINPVLSVLEIAARGELGETARELILLNAFKKRIMAQKQTVGGAIDVAVISRDAGFQWHARQDGERVYG
jgi:hypothetical protein